MKIPALISCLLLTLGSCQSNALMASPAPAELDAENVIWNSPSLDSHGSMPLGNGQTVLNVWVEKGTGDLMILLARSDSLSEICRFLKLGRLRVHIDGNPLAGADFKQELILREGRIQISGGGVALSVLVDAEAQVVHIMGTNLKAGKPLSVSAKIENWRDADRQLPAAEKVASWTTHDAPFPLIESGDRFSPSPKAIVWYHRNETSVVPKLLETQSLTGAKGAFDPLLHRTFGGHLSGAGFTPSGERELRSAQNQSSFALALATHTAQTDTAEAWLKQVENEAAKSSDYARALGRTQNWWSQFWARSWVVAHETQGLPKNQLPLSLGKDSSGGNRFPGEIIALPVLGKVQSAAEIAASAAQARPAKSIEPKMPEGAAALTFSAWIKADSLGSGRLFDKITPGGSDGFLFDQQGASLRLIVGGRILLTPACLKSGQWQHAAASVAADGVRAIYVDGKLIASARGGTVTRGYTLQRYAQAIQGRGSYPIKFNGGFFNMEANGFSADWRNWGDCYWWQNTRHMYHPMLACGDIDLMQPLFKMYEDAVPLAESRTAKYHGAQGAYFPETMTLFGTYGGDYVWDRRGKQPSEVGCPWWDKAWNQGPELVALMLDRFDYTHDKAFLKNQVLPMAVSVLDYFDSRFKKDAEGKILIDPTQAVETYWHGVVNDAPTVAGLVNLSRRLNALAADQLSPTQRELFTRIAAACPPIPVEGSGTTRQLAPAAKYNPQRSNCENPETYAIWPYREVCLSRPELLAEGRQAYAKRQSQLPNGWGYDGNVAALLGLTDEAERILQIKCANSNPGYRWPATWGPNFDWLPDQNHGGNLLETTNLMLLQGESGGKILLLPAWPKSWDVSFKLHAPDVTTVECVYRGGKILKLEVTPKERAKDVVLPEFLRSASGQAPIP